MGFLARLLVLYMSEKDAFWSLATLLEGALHAPMEGLYLVRSFKRLDKQKSCFLTFFCSSGDQMMIGARFVFVDFWCKQ
jgi:hypothetical protein